MGRRGSGVRQLSGVPIIHLGTKGVEDPMAALQTKGALYHELGHLKEKMDTVQKRGYMPAYAVQPMRSRDIRIGEERRAWKEAKPYLTHPVQHWARRVAMATHLRQLEKVPSGHFKHVSQPLSEEDAKAFVRKWKLEGKKIDVKGKGAEIEIEINH